MNIRKLPEKFKSFAVVETITDFVIEDDHSRLVREVKYHRIPNLLEPSMEKVNKAWRFYSKKFMRNPTIAATIGKMSTSGDINITGNLKILVDLKEQMEFYKEHRDLDGMIMTMRTIYAALKLLGYKRGPCGYDEYTDKDMKVQAQSLLDKYKL